MRERVESRRGGGKGVTLVRTRSSKGKGVGRTNNEVHVWYPMQQKDGAKQALGGLQQRSGEEAVVSYYFTNFPTSVGVKDLWKTFMEWGRVVDVFIPNKINKERFCKVQGGCLSSGA